MRHLVAIFFACLALAAPAAADRPEPVRTGGDAGSSARPFRVFIANSYNPEYFWSARQREGIVAALKGLEVEVVEHFMDTKRNPGEDFLSRAAAKTIAAIDAFAPDILFTGDDNATRTVGKHYLGSELPVVFYGVNAEPEGYGLVAPGRRARPGRNVTGVLERHLFAEGVDLLQTLCESNQCGVRQLFLITDDSYTSVKLFEYLRGVDWKTPMRVTFIDPVSTFDQYKRKLHEINKPGNALIIYNLQSIDGPDGQPLHYRAIMKWTRETLTVPTVAFHEDYIREGALIGVLVSGFSQAYHAGLKGRAILTGTPAGEVPVEPPARGKLTVNTTTMQKLGLKIPLSLLLGATVYTYDDG